MSNHHKLSLWSAVLVNFNIMFGTGIFINTLILAQLAGFLGFLSYLCILAVIAPLVYVIMQQLNRHPTGGFYTYGAKDLNSLAGFFSGWTYFIGKLASGILLIHVFSSLLQTIIPAFQFLPILVIDAFIIILFTWLNTLHMSTGKSIMYLFLVLKVTPILFAILSCIYLYNFWSVPAESFKWAGIPSTLPLVLYAFAGFEATCSISSSIQNAKKNAPRAILISFCIIVLITILYQFFMYLTIGHELLGQTDYLTIFPTLLANLFPSNPMLAYHVTSLLHIALATACLGGSYGILFSDHWNLYTLAQHDHTFFKKWLTKFNKHQIPTACVFVQGAIGLLYLIISKGDIIPLQQISVLGVAIAYFVSVLGLVSSNGLKNESLKTKIIPWLGIASCLVIFITIVRNFIQQGMISLVLFCIMIAIGLVMFYLTPGSRAPKQVA